MRTHVSALVAALSLLTMLVTSPAPSFADAPREGAGSADKKARARALAVVGFEALQRGEVEQAIERFSEAERLYHAVTIVLLLAQAHEKLGRVVEARALYRSILDEELPPLAPKEFVDAKSEARRGFDALAGRFATLVVRAPGAAPGDVTLTIDGEVASPMEAVHAVNPGQHTLTLAARSGASVTRSVSLRAGDDERVVVPMAALDPYGERARFAPAAVAFGVGVVGLGVGVVTASLAIRHASDVSSRCESSRCSPASSASSARAAESLGVASTLSFVAGGAGLATSAIWLFLGRAPSPSAGSTAPRPTIAIAASPTSLSIRGAF